MPKVQLIGKVRPEPWKVSIPVRDIHWRDDNGFEGNFKVRIADSIVNIECEPLNKFSENLNLIVIRAFDLARANINLVGFATGQGLTVDFEFVIDPLGTPSMIVPNNPPLANHCTSYRIDQAASFDQIYNIVVGNPDIARLLNDLMQSITTPHVSPVSCGRAMDGIKHLISGNIRDEKKAWKIMRDALNVHEDYLRFIMSTSTDPRHGRPGHVPSNVTDDVCNRAWVIMNRFFEYKKDGDKKLSLVNFPLLK